MLNIWPIYKENDDFVAHSHKALMGAFVVIIEQQANEVFGDHYC